MKLPDTDLALIEAMRRYASLETKGLLSIIDRQSTALRSAIDQRDRYILDEYPEEMAIMNIRVHDEEVQAILNGEVR